MYNALWGYYLVTGDEEFLRTRLIPAYKEMALFYEDYACDRGPEGKVIFCPSFSPEDSIPNPGCETVSCRILVGGQALPMDGDHGAYAFRAGETVSVEIQF